MNELNIKKQKVFFFFLLFCADNYIELININNDFLTKYFTEATTKINNLSLESEYYFVVVVLCHYTICYVWGGLLF